MNLGIGTLAELKARLLNEALQGDDTRFDGTLALLGKGVSRRFEQHCNRKFARVVDDVFEFAANRAHVVVPRFPIESLSALEIRDTLAEGWIDQGEISGIVDNYAKEAGLVHFAAELSLRPAARARLTYTGGFYIDLSGDGSPGSSPAIVQQGSVDLDADDESKAVTFDTEFTAEPNVDCRIIPPAEASIPIIESRPSAITTEGFTALIGFPIPSAGYKLQWEARVASTTDAAPEEMPAGATARPDDLYFAWLMQAEHIWKAIDRLGIDLARDVGGAQQAVTQTLGSAELASEPKAILRAYAQLTGT